MQNKKREITHTEQINMKECLNVNFVILITCGHWIPVSFHGTIKEYLYKLFSAFCVISFVISPILSEVISAVVVFGDVEKFVESMFFTVAHVAWVSKVYTSIRYHDRIQNLLDKLKEPIFSTVDRVSSKSVRGTMQQHVAITVVFLVLSLITAICFALFPFLSSNDMTLPIPAWFPIDIYKSNRFMKVYAYQVICICYVAGTNVSYDTLIAGTISMACGQLDLLCNKLADKHRRIGLISAGEGRLVKEKDLSSLISENETKNHIFNCIEHHLEIIRYVEITEEIFGHVAFMQFCSSCLIVCFTAFQLTVVTSIIEIFGIMLYMMCMLIELFLMCYFGNELIIKSHRLSLAAYESLWYETNNENRKSIYTLMERAKRPLQVKAVIFTLSLASFMSVLRSSYSYYAILRRVNNR